MSSIQDRIKAATDEPERPAFKTDPGERVQPRVVVPRPHRITIDLTSEQYRRLRSWRTADLNLSGVVRSTIDYLASHPEVVNAIREESDHQ